MKRYREAVMLKRLRGNIQFSHSFYVNELSSECLIGSCFVNIVVAEKRRETSFFPDF